MKAARLEFKTSFDNAGRSIDETRRQHQRNLVRTSKWEMHKRQYGYGYGLATVGVERKDTA